MRQHFIVVAAVLTALLLPVTAFGQSTDIQPDDRYNGYPRSLVSWPMTTADLLTCVGQEYYEPLDTHLWQYTSRVKVGSIRVQRYDECTWMRTRNGDRWVLRPVGTKVAIDGFGRDLFDYGSPQGRQCGNPRSVSIPIIPAPPVVAEMPLPPRFVPPPFRLPSSPQPRPRRPVYLPPIKEHGAPWGKIIGIAAGVGVGVWACLKWCPDNEPIVAALSPLPPSTAINREPTKGGIPVPGGGPNPPNNPGGSPPLRIAFRF